MTTATTKRVRFFTLLDQWEKKQKGAHSRLRDMPPYAVRKIAKILSPLSDDELAVAFDVFETCTQCESDNEADAKNLTGEGDGITPRFRSWIRLIERYTLNRAYYESAQYCVLLAPVWFALNGTGGNPGYAMGQAIYRQRRTHGTTSPEPFLKGKGREDRLALLIGRMMQAQVGGHHQIAVKDEAWFGNNWKGIAPVWLGLIKSNNFDRERVQLLIDYKDSGGSAGIMDGVL